MNFSQNKSPTTPKPAFTLVELLISMSIIAIMAAMSISAYPKFSEQITLSGETYKMLAYFRETQSYGISAEATPGVKFVYAFTVDKTDSSIKRVQIQNPSKTDKTNNYYITGSSVDSTATISTIKTLFEVSQIDGINSTGTTSLQKGYAFFRRPNPEARLIGTFGVTNNIAPSKDDSASFDRIEITLRSKRNPAFTKKIVILSTGQMYVSDW